MNPKMTPDARLLLSAIVLAEWGAILTYFYCGQRITAYLHPNLRPLVLVTGILLVISAGCVLCFEKTCSQLVCDEGCATRHREITLGGLLWFAVLVLPIALAAKISPDSFGSGFVENRGVRKTIVAARAPPDRWASAPIFMPGGGSRTDLPISAAVNRPTPASLANDDYRTVGILDLMRAAQNPLVRQDFDGRRVGLSGRFLPQNANHFELVCMFITCCAVDAQLLAVRVDTNEIPLFDKLTWTKVIGRVSFVKVGEDTMPVIAAEKIATIPVPPEPLVYGPSRHPQWNRPARR